MKKLSPGSFVAGVMLGLVAAGAWLLRAQVPLPHDIEAPLATTTEPISSESGALSVESQPAGEHVIAQSVTVPPPGVWVAVRETDGGELANVLGAARVSGPRTNVNIPLLRATLPRHRYAVELYRDDNGGAFDPAANSVYVDFDSGERVVTYFVTK